MRAAVVESYGGPEVVQVIPIPRPVPKADEVLVRVRAAAVTSGDARIRGARFPSGFAPFARLAFGVRRPRRRVLGSAFAGEVDSVGARVEGFAAGDRVCGMNGARMGAHAEYLAVPATRLVRTPDGVSDDDAAGVLFGGTTALHFVREPVGLAAGDTVLVIGASGAVGTNVVQLARMAGATVTAVTSGANAALVADLGATSVIDHTTVDVTGLSERYDAVIDTVGVLGIPEGRRLLRDGGTLALVAAGLADTLRARRGVVAGPAPERVGVMAELLDMVADGRLRVVIDAAEDLDRISEAYARVDSGRKVGNVVVHP